MNVIYFKIREKGRPFPFPRPWNGWGTVPWKGQNSMLKIEIMRFEAQDIITSSVAASCLHADYVLSGFEDGSVRRTCSDCKCFQWGTADENRNFTPSTEWMTE